MKRRPFFRASIGLKHWRRGAAENLHETIQLLKWSGIERSTNDSVNAAAHTEAKRQR
jgi:hypothetical protein